MRHTLLALTATIALSGVVTGACAQPSPAGDSPESAVVYIPTVPKSLNFAGELVPLNLADVRESLEREVSVTMYMHSRTMNTLRNVTRYFPVIEPILNANGIPEDFKYLCMAESGLNPNAVSSAKAAGLWQFMTSAAKDYGVETGDNVDMRFHVEESTRAACKYLNAAYKRYGSWTMAAASYNAGLAGVTRRMNTQGVENYYDLFLPEETMRYVYRILTFKLLVENPRHYGFHLKQNDYLPPFDNYREVKVNSSVIDWSAFATAQGTNYKVLRILNPWIRSYEYNNTSGKTYTVKVPNQGFRENGR